MAITQGEVLLQETASPTKRLLTVSRLDSLANTAHSETFVLIDPDDGSNTSMAKVMNTSPAGTEYGLITRNIPSGVQHIDDNSGSLTVDSPVGTPLNVRLSDGSTAYDFDHSVDFDTGAPVVNRVSVGLIVPASGGPVSIGGSSANGLQVDVTRVQGVVHIDDNSGSLTVDAPVGSPVFVRLSDGAAALVGQKTMANSIPVVLASDQSSVSVTVSGIVSTDSRRGVTLLFKSISVAASGDTALVSASVSNKVKVTSYVIVSSGTVNAKFDDGTVDLTGAMALVANSGVSAQGDCDSWLMETAAVNRPLNINLSAAVQVSGHLAYFLEA